MLHGGLVYRKTLREVSGLERIEVRWKSAASFFTWFLPVSSEFGATRYCALTMAGSPGSATIGEHSGWPNRRTSRSWLSSAARLEYPDVFLTHRLCCHRQIRRSESN